MAHRRHYLTRKARERAAFRQALEDYRREWIVHTLPDPRDPTRVHDVDLPVGPGQDAMDSVEELRRASVA
jgi:hypothetical protein